MATKHGVEAKNYEGLGDAAKLKPLEVKEDNDRHQDSDDHHDHDGDGDQLIMMVTYLDLKIYL